MKTWIWPLSWYYRIKQLEQTVAVLTLKNKELEHQLAAECIAHTGAITSYVAAMESIMQQSAASYKALAERTARLPFSARDAQ